MKKIVSETNKRKRDWKSDISLLISIIAVLFTYIESRNTSKQFHSLNDPAVVVEGSIIDTSRDTKGFIVAVGFANKGNTLARNVSIVGGLSSTQDIPGVTNDTSTFTSRVMVMYPHDSKTLWGHFEKKIFEYIIANKIDIVLTVTINYENSDGDKFKYESKEKIDVEAKRFFVISSIIEKI